MDLERQPGRSVQSDESKRAVKLGLVEAAVNDCVPESVRQLPVDRFAAEV
jgi:hypothetical protein